MKKIRSSRSLFYGGLILLAGGLSCFPHANEQASNLPALLGPWGVLLGYVLIGISIVMKPEENKNEAAQ